MTGHRGVSGTGRRTVFRHRLELAYTQRVRDRPNQADSDRLEADAGRLRAAPADLLFSTSRNAVDYALTLFPGGVLPARPRLAAVGQATAEALMAAGLVRASAVAVTPLLPLFAVML